MKSFIFLYPIPEIINNEITKLCVLEEENIAKQKYKQALNSCIDLRYRKNGFAINFATFDNHEISDIIELQPGDKIIEVGLDYMTHVKLAKYPAPDKVIDQLGDITTIRIAGFHMWDCVEKLAKRAHERGLDTLVDEDLTEFLAYRLRDKDFRFDTYPTFNPKKMRHMSFEEFMESRREMPWLWQDYA